MRRFWLLLLLFILPLQMSWAAAHVCDDERLVAQAVAAAALASHAHEAPSGHQSDGGVGKMSDDCCGAAHGCHGLHHLMAQEEASLPSAGSAAIVVLRDTPSKCGYVAKRVERPKWLAA